MNRLLTHAVGPVPVDGLTAFAEPRSGGVGAVLPFAVWGQAGARWSDMALGVLTRDVGSASRVASARADALDTVERWCLMAPRRCALPVRGYCWCAHSDWIEVGPLWAPCISEDDRRLGAGAVVIADPAADHRAPVLMDVREIGIWLTAPLWQAMALVRGSRAAA